MKKIIILCIVAAVLLSGCNLKEVTRIFPVEDFMVVEDSIIATFELDGIKNKFEFGEDYIYPCEYSSRIIAEGVENGNGFRSYDLYLYLSVEDYEKYLGQRFDLEDYEAQKEDLKQQITNLQVELNELERMVEQEKEGGE